METAGNNQNIDWTQPEAQETFETMMAREGLKPMDVGQTTPANFANQAARGQEEFHDCSLTAPVGDIRDIDASKHAGIPTQHIPDAEEQAALDAMYDEPQENE